ncbi:thioesterase family protein [Bacteroidales bacterium AH-315-N07]|nr:thioesterase family protein [Bacteroidales bacterium AH-315-N07]
MGRIKIELPAQFHFSTEIAVRIDDINYGGHLGNDSVLSIIHEARMQFLAHFGFKENDIGGVGLIMADTAIVYKSESFHGDILKVDVATGEFSKVGFDIFYRITNIKNDREVARAKTGMVCFDYEDKKIKPVPEEFRMSVNIN